MKSIEGFYFFTIALTSVKQDPPAYNSTIMRLILIVSLASAIMFSCTSSDTTKIATDSPGIQKQVETTVSTFGRQVLIEELKRLRTIFISDDKEKIAGVFQFPVPDTTLALFIEDSGFNEELRKNGDKLTKDMFLRFYPQVYENLQIGELKQLFKNLQPDSLLRKDGLEYKVIKREEPCYKFYIVEAANDHVTLSVGSAVNDIYRGDSLDGDLEENSSEYCEHVLWWVFGFDGKRLKVIKIYGAG